MVKPNHVEQFSEIIELKISRRKFIWKSFPLSLGYMGFTHS